MRYVIALTLLMSGLWLGISGVYKPLMFVFGGASVALVVWLSVRMHVVGVQHNPVLYSWRLPAYWLWLIGQIVCTSINVARLVLNPKGIRPRVFRAPMTPRSSVAKVTYANSITLTPGTVTLLLEPDFVDVHALDDKSAASVVSGSMAKRVCWLEGGKVEK